MSEVYLSRDGYEKLQEELKELKGVERPTVRKALKVARDARILVTRGYVMKALGHWGMSQPLGTCKKG